MKGSLYSASDKAIFDALNNSKVTNSDLRNLFLSRGIIISSDTSREELANIFSRLIHDYDDNQELATIFSSIRRREKITPVRITNEIPIDTIDVAAQRLKSSIEDDDTQVTVLKMNNNSLQIKINYKSMDYNKTEFKQVIDKPATIIVDKDNDGLSIQSPLNPNVQGWITKLTGFIEEEIEEDIFPYEVSLEHIQNHTIRTSFFIKLIDSIDGYTLHNVTDVYVYHADIEEEKELLEDKEITESGIHIDKASLSGQGVLHSPELKDLCDKGFYISKIIWQSKVKNSIDSDIYIFEALFSEPDTCTNFSYLPKSFLRYKGDGEYNKSSTNFSKEEENKLNKLIEKAAYKALKLISEKLVTNVVETDNEN